MLRALSYIVTNDYIIPGVCLTGMLLAGASFVLMDKTPSPAGGWTCPAGMVPLPDQYIVGRPICVPGVLAVRTERQDQ